MFNRKDAEIIDKFKKLNTRVDVADLLEIDDKSLRYFLFVIPLEKKYVTFEIKKKNGSSRVICAPVYELKCIQRKLAYVLSLIYSPKLCAYGFIQDKNIVDNARHHIRRSYVLNIDLKNFFNQIHFGRIRGMLKAAPYGLGDEAATTIAQLSCFNGSLPQGAPSSPILTNMVCAPLDNQLMSFSKRNNMVYTRYADDLSFSPYRQTFTQEVLSLNDGQLNLGNGLLNIIKKNNFEINQAKTKLKAKTERQEVTGLIVNKFPNLKYNYIKNLRAILYNCKAKGVYHTAIEYIGKGFCHNPAIIKIENDPIKEDIIVVWFKQVIKGKINYIKFVKGIRSITFLKFAQQANEIFDEPLFDITALDELNDIINRNTFILKCDTPEVQGSGFYVKEIGLITNSHVTDNGGFFNVFTPESYSKNTNLGIISKSINELISNKTIDYAIYKLNIDNITKVNIGDSSKLKVGDKVIIAGYPNFKRGDTVTKQSCEIIGITSYFGAPFYKISGRIVHGASGGIVLNSDNEAIGIIKGGIASLDEDATNDMQGFVPLHLVIEDIRNRNMNIDI